MARQQVQVWVGGLDGQQATMTADVEAGLAICLVKQECWWVVHAASGLPISNTVRLDSARAARAFRALLFEFPGVDWRRPAGEIRSSQARRDFAYELEWGCRHSQRWQDALQGE